MITLSPDQAQALESILSAVLLDGAREIVLVGPAGSGKTTIVKRMIDDLERAGLRIVLVAPTGKAAVRLAALTGRSATTIHGPLYRDICETLDGGVEFGRPEAVASLGSIVICDEASMLGSRLYADLRSTLPDSVPLLCIGDKAQLPPVNDTWGADFEAPTAALTSIHRQAEASPIICLATAVREGRGVGAIAPDGVGYCYRRGTLEDVAAWASLGKMMGDDLAVLTHSNRARHALNDRIRSARGHAGDIEIGDVLLCTRNAHRVAVMNGEVVEVAEFEPIEGSGGRLVSVTFADGRAAVVAPEALARGETSALWDELEELADLCDVDGGGWDLGSASPWSRPSTKKRMMRAQYGEALTVHKSQGSQWHSVGVVLDASFLSSEERDPDLFARLLYTAITRASGAITLWEI